MKHFKDSEFNCQCGCGLGKDNMSVLLAIRLDEAREQAGVPFVINSAIRCEAHNANEGGSPASSHLKGLAIDIKCDTARARFKMVKALMATGFTRVLIYPEFIHADIDPDKVQDIMPLMG